jgi:hypothetical protein
MLNIDDRLIKEVSPKIRPNALSVLLAIAIHVNQKTNRSFPSHKRLMALTGLGRDAVYIALNVLKDNGLLAGFQEINTKTGQFGRRTFKITTRFIGIFIAIEDAEPLPEYPYTDKPDTVNQETKPITNSFEQINNKELTFPGEMPGRVSAGNSKAPKEKKQKPPSAAGGEPWTKEAARIFDAVLQDCQKETPEEEKLTFNWQAGAGRHFASLKKLRDAMAADMRRKMEKDTLSEEDYKKGFEIIFSNGFEYLRGIAANLGGSIKFSPAIILNNYNQILHHARTKHITRQNNPRQNDDAGRTAFYQELARSSSNLDL